MNKDIVCRYCNVRYKSVFTDLNELELNLLSTVKTCVEFKKGQVVFRENTNPRGLYCINSGKFKLSRMGSDQKEQIVHLAQSGDVMGFRALLAGGKYNCTATALEDSYACYIPKETFSELMTESPKLAKRLLSLFSEMLRETEIKLTVLGQNNVKERLIHSLCSLIDKYGFEQDGSTINLAIRRQELADMSGTTRETATRLLFELEDEKIIKIQGRKICVTNYAQLLKISQMQ
jgi:CRP/FNR family transcriptional regulator, polysaccharide utilization system transcription regulator